MNILITGTSSGIGNGLAGEYLKRGNRVMGTSRRKAIEFADLQMYSHLQCDLTNYAEVTEKLPELLKGSEMLDLVILNAGILGKIKYMEEVSLEEMKKVFEINVWANKVLLDLILKSEIPVKQVVGISSGSALRSTPGWGSYSMSKAGLDRLINIYAKEFPETHFIAFAPGLVDTFMQDTIYQINDTSKYPSAKTLQKARYTDQMPDPTKAASMLIEGFEKALNFESGSHVDIREM
jgi:NAD(P)-dependent dehydrogenase (short-subunit alcohol dehydrogenase family)